MPEKKLKVYEVIVNHTQLHTSRLFNVVAYDIKEAQAIYIKAQGTKDREIVSIKKSQKRFRSVWKEEQYGAYKERGWVDD